MEKNRTNLGGTKEARPLGAGKRTFAKKEILRGRPDKEGLWPKRLQVKDEKKIWEAILRGQKKEKGEGANSRGR